MEDNNGIQESVEIKDGTTGETLQAEPSVQSAPSSAITFADVANYAGIPTGSSLADITRIFAAQLEEFKLVLTNPEATDQERIIALSRCIASDMIWNGMLGSLDTQARIEMLSNIKAKKLSGN